MPASQRLLSGSRPRIETRLTAESSNNGSRRRRTRRRWPGASVPGSALRGPPGPHAGPSATGHRRSTRLWQLSRSRNAPSSSLLIVQLAAAALGRPWGVATRSSAPNLDPVAVRMVCRACGIHGQTRISGSGGSVRCHTCMRGGKTGPLATVSGDCRARGGGGCCAVCGVGLPAFARV